MGVCGGKDLLDNNNNSNRKDGEGREEEGGKRGYITEGVHRNAAGIERSYDDENLINTRTT